MPGLLTPEILAAIGQAEPPMRVEVTRREIMKYAVATEQRLEKYLRGDEAPPMFVFGAFRDVVPLDELGPDGIARSSSMPELPLKRVMAGGFRFQYFAPDPARRCAGKHPRAGRHSRKAGSLRPADLPGL